MDKMLKIRAAYYTPMCITVQVSSTQHNLNRVQVQVQLHTQVVGASNLILCLNRRADISVNVMYDNNVN